MFGGRDLPHQLEAEGRELNQARDMLQHKRRLLQEASFHDKATKWLMAGFKTVLAFFGAGEAAALGEVLPKVVDTLGSELGPGHTAGPAGGNLATEKETDSGFATFRRENRLSSLGEIENRTPQPCARRNACLPGAPLCQVTLGPRFS